MEERDASSSLSPVLALLAAVLALYVGGYGWARLTHRLVYRGPGSGVSAPHPGFGFTTWELVFLPLALLESRARP